MYINTYPQVETQKQMYTNRMITYGIQQNDFLTPKSKATSERATIIEMFVKEYNEECVKKFQRKPARMGMLLSHIKETRDLFVFLNGCREFKRKNGSFGKYFNWAIKPQK